MIVENSIEAMRYPNNFKRVPRSFLALGLVPIEVFPLFST